MFPSCSKWVLVPSVRVFRAHFGANFGQCDIINAPSSASSSDFYKKNYQILKECCWIFPKCFNVQTLLPNFRLEKLYDGKCSSKCPAKILKSNVTSKIEFLIIFRSLKTFENQFESEFMSAILFTSMRIRWKYLPQSMHHERKMFYR